MSQGKIFLLPTPISDNDVSLIVSQQVRQVLASTKWFFVENVRTSRRFISSLQLGVDISSLHFLELSKDTPDADVPKLLDVVAGGENGAVLSEAGCPGIADPGARLVIYAHRKNIEVVPLAGPSSIFMSLMSSGFSGQSFTFHGYLPIDKPMLLEKIRQMEKEVSQKGTTQIFMETPFRNNQLLDMLLTTCHSATLLCVASNITAANEMIKTKIITEWRAAKPDLHKIPTVFLLGR